MLTRAAVVQRRIGILLLLFATCPWSLSAATSASFEFDFAADPADLADGPVYRVAGTGLVDDGAFPGCDVVVMLIADATGTLTDPGVLALSSLRR